MEGVWIDSESTVVHSVMPLVALSLYSVAGQLMFKCKDTDLGFDELSSGTSATSLWAFVFRTVSPIKTPCFGRSVVALVGAALEMKPLARGESQLVLFVQVLYLYSGEASWARCFCS